MIQQMATGFFCDHTGKRSSMRLLSAMSLLAAIYFSYLSISNAETLRESKDLIYAFLFAAFGPKTAQKYIETEQKVTHSSDHQT